MPENEADDYLPELEDMITGRNFTIALDKYEQCAGKEIPVDQSMERRIYEGIFEDAKKLIERKLKHLPKYLKSKNFHRLKLEREVLVKNLDYLNLVFSKVENRNEYDDFVRDFKKYARSKKAELHLFAEQNDALIKETESKLTMDHERKKGKASKKEIIGKKPRVRLTIEPREGDYHDKNMEYLPFLGVTTIRLRVVINRPVKDLWIKPKFTPDLYSVNPEWSFYVCGMNNEHQDFDLRKGFIAAYGGGELSGFKIGNVKKRQQYVFFFLRHHDETLKTTYDFSITFDAVEEMGWSQVIYDSITIQLRYPADIRPSEGQERDLPDFEDSKCPVIARYDYDYERGQKYREILFKGNMLPSYYSRWLPSRKIEYDSVSDSLKEKIGGLMVRSFPKGDVKLYYKFKDGYRPRLIGHLKGNISDSVFYDPLKMVTAELFRFYSDDFVALRIWFWWIDYRMNDEEFCRKTLGIKHEMPDFERVDFIINLKNPTRNEQMVEFVATDVHWKEFWLDTKDVEGDRSIGVKFTDIGLNFINWKQLTAYFSHNVGFIYNPLPAILYTIYQTLDGNAFYCVMCGEKKETPKNKDAIRERLKGFDEKDLTKKKIKRKTKEITSYQMADLMCSKCQTLIKKEKNIPYIQFFGDFSKIEFPADRLHLNKILQKDLKKKTKEGGTKLALNYRNCHVPTPVDGETSQEMCSSTVTKPLPEVILETDQEYEAKILIPKIDFYEITNLEGLNNIMAERLYKKGIVKLRSLIEASADDLLYKVDLEGLRDKEKDYYKSNILHWKDMAELYQLTGVRSQYSAVLVKLDMNLNRLRNYEGDFLAIQTKVEIYNKTHNLSIRTPSLSEIENWIQQAKSLPTT